MLPELKQGIRTEHRIRQILDAKFSEKLSPRKSYDLYNLPVSGRQAAADGYYIGDIVISVSPNVNKTIFLDCTNVNRRTDTKKPSFRLKTSGKNISRMAEYCHNLTDIFETYRKYRDFESKNKFLEKRSDLCKYLDMCLRLNEKGLWWRSIRFEIILAFLWNDEVFLLPLQNHTLEFLSTTSDPSLKNVWDYTVDVDTLTSVLKA